jgi:prepilin-type processing-associated H-X9-DG protein
MDNQYFQHDRMKQYARKAVTIVELLVVIAIIGLLIADLLPAVQAVREVSRRATCQSHLKQIALAVDMYHDSQRRFPQGQFKGPYGEGPDSQAWSWLARLLPQLEENSLYSLGGVPQKTLRDSQIADRQIELFLCPSDGESYMGARLDAGNMVGFPVGQSNYKGVSGANWGHDSSQGLTDIGTDWVNPGTNGTYDGQDYGDGILFRSDFKVRRTRQLLRDGASKTYMIGEDVPLVNIWCSWPYANNAYGTCAIPPNLHVVNGGPSWWPNSAGFRSEHGGGLHFAYADGSVHFISEEIDLGVYRAMATIAGGEIMRAD